MSFRRTGEASRAALTINVDGTIVPALAGDTVLTALRLAGMPLRTSEFGDGPRGGFCLMGACQDCWLTVDGRRARACQAHVADGMLVGTHG